MRECVCVWVRARERKEKKFIRKLCSHNGSDDDDGDDNDDNNDINDDDGDDHDDNDNDIGIDNDDELFSVHQFVVDNDPGFIYLDFLQRSLVCLIARVTSSK